MNYNITIDHQSRLIRYKHSGTLEQQEIGYVWTNEFLKMREFTQLQYNLFSDYSDAKFNIPTSFLPELIAFMKEIEPIVRGKKQGIVVDDPYSTAASLIFEHEVNKAVGFQVKVFNTHKAALNWLLS